MKLKYDTLLSSFAFNFNLRRYTVGVSSTACTGTALCGGTVCKTFTQASEFESGGYGDVPTVVCPANTVGRFVYIQLLGDNRIINIYEVQVAFTGGVTSLAGLTAVGTHV